MFRGKRHVLFIARSAVIFMIAQFFALGLHAKTPLFFKENQSPTLRLLISENPEITSLTESGYEVAEADLNRDGTPEYILKSENCTTQRKFCDFFVLAVRDNDSLVLAQLSASRVVVDNKKNHGILDILAFNVHKNDYDYTRYVWLPSQMKYVPEEDVR